MKADFHHATVAMLAYEDESPELKSKFKDLGYSKATFIDIDGAQAYILSNNEHITIAFRGTEPGEMSDVFADLKAWKSRSQVAGKVHDGFYDEIKKVWDKITYAVNKHKGKSLTVCGHSLGGAMATICAARLSNAGHDLVLYTYGSPRVGDKVFVSNIKCQHRRWVNNNDVVTKVPLWIMGFRHHGELCYLNHYGNVRNGLNPWQRFKDGWRGRLAAWRNRQPFDGARDHSIGDYAAKISKHCKDC